VYRFLRWLYRSTSESFLNSRPFVYMRVPVELPAPRHGFIQRLPEYLQLATQVAGVVQATVKAGHGVLPYLRPLALAAAL